MTELLLSRQCIHGKVVVAGALLLVASAVAATREIQGWIG